MSIGANIRAHGCDGLIYLMPGNDRMGLKSMATASLTRGGTVPPQFLGSYRENSSGENGLARPNGFPKRNQVRRFPDAPDFSAYA
jgi:hypothetical protein